MIGSALRLLVGFFAPAAVGVLIFDLTTTTFDGPASVNHFYTAYMRFLPYAYPLVGMQSAAYSLLMEFVVNRAVRSVWLILLISVALGAMSGRIVDERLTSLGALTGLIVGAILIILYRYSYTMLHGDSPRSDVTTSATGNFE